MSDLYRVEVTKELLDGRQVTAKIRRIDDDTADEAALELLREAEEVLT